MTEANQSAYQASLSYVDLLYAVPVADLATRVSSTHLHGITPSGWGDIMLALIAITFGWIGHHTNRQHMPAVMADARLRPERPFAGARFLQFAVEVGIIGAYFALGTRAYLPHEAGVGTLSEIWKAQWLLIIFGLYLVWDGLDIHIARRLRSESEEAVQLGEDKQRDVKELQVWGRRAKAGGVVTFIFVLVFGGFLLVALAGPRHGLHTVVAFDGAAIAVLYAYRRIQGYVRNCIPEAA
jgi:hypothetical protein